ncbi:MAG: methyltransferase domain-containing protein [Candidatus Gottesmanbacteria bacterium]
MNINKYITEFKENPVDIVSRIFHKVLFDPIKYSNGQDYRAAEYWSNRLSRYRYALKGVGDEGVSEKENEKRYKNTSIKLMTLLKQKKIDCKRIRVLDIGSGNGFYAQLLANLGVTKYVGLDITDCLFPKLKKQFPLFKFFKKDISQDRIGSTYDLILMIDVTEHIVTEDRLTMAMDNVKKSLSPSGTFIVLPLMKYSKRIFYYLKIWSVKDLRKRFPNYSIEEIPLDNESFILLIRRF